MAEGFLSPGSCSALRTAQKFSVPVFLLCTLFFADLVQCAGLGS